MKLQFDKNNIRLFILFLLVVVGGWFYLSFNYLKLDEGVTFIKVAFNKPLKSNTPVGYILDSAQAQFDLTKPQPFQRVNDSVFLLPFTKAIRLHQFRIYFSPTQETIFVKDIILHTTKDKSLSFDKFKTEKINSTERKGSTEIRILSPDGFAYMESPRFSYSSDYFFIRLGIFAMALTITLLFWFLLKFGLINSLLSASLMELSVFLFISSLFLTQAFFNITLLISFLFIIKNFDFSQFLKNKLNLIFIAFFFLVIINFFLVLPDFKFSAIEKYFVFLGLPFYTSCIRQRKILDFLYISPLIIGVALLAVAGINIFVFRNPEIVSFNNFTGVIHPVYYSYLLSFAIVYVELNILSKKKYLIQVILLLLLILCGSKLILFITFFWLAFFVDKKIGFSLVFVLVCSVFVFAPLRDRFRSIVNFSDLSIINEKHINDPNDPRLNGITVRIIFWQENLNFPSWKHLLFGMGISETGGKTLEKNILDRGLTGHTEYNAHNQYLTTLYRMGLVGFILLLAMLYYSLRVGIKTSNQELIFFVLLMTIAMMSESIFERMFGIAFFCLVVGILINVKSLNSKPQGDNLKLV